MTHATEWGDAFEALPTDDNYGYEIDNYIRELKVSTRERIAVDHEMKVSTTHDGKHKKVTFRKQTANPTTGTEEGFLFTKDVSDKIELFWKDEDGNVVQLTSAGKILSFPSGTEMVFYQDTAPTGWTINNVVNDKLLIVSKGSAAGGETGGTDHPTGTWTQPNHTLTTDEIPAHTHSIAGYNGSGGERYAYEAGSGTPISTDSTGSAGGGGAHNHGSSWRPGAYVVIIAEKD